MYDDYLSSSQSKLDSLDAQSIATVLQTLRKICNHPQLLETASEDGSNNQHHLTKNNPLHSVPEKANFATDDSLSFSRIIDGLRIPYMVSKAANYDPMTEINLASLNLVFFTHESTLTAITSDRIRKCCAPKTLIEELNSSSMVSSSSSSSNTSISSSSALAPQVPLYQFNFGTEGWSLDSQAKTSRVQNHVNTNSVNKQLTEKSGKQHSRQSVWSSSVRELHQQSSASPAFQRDSLNVIAKFNERRCNGMPLYGQDLIEVLTIVSPGM